MITNFFERYLIEKTKHLGKIFGEYCDHWIDYDILLSIQNNSLRKRYENSCYQPVISIQFLEDNKPPLVNVKCQCCDIRKPSQCKKKFSKLECFWKEYFKRLKKVQFQEDFDQISEKIIKKIQNK